MGGDLPSGGGEEALVLGGGGGLSGQPGVGAVQEAGDEGAAEGYGRGFARMIFALAEKLFFAI